MHPISCFLHAVTETFVRSVFHLQISQKGWGYALIKICSAHAGLWTTFSINILHLSHFCGQRILCRLSEENNSTVVYTIKNILFSNKSKKYLVDDNYSTITLLLWPLYFSPKQMSGGSYQELNMEKQSRIMLGKVV